MLTFEPVRGSEGSNDPSSELAELIEEAPPLPLLGRRLRYNTQTHAMEQALLLRPLVGGG